MGKRRHRSFCVRFLTIFTANLLIYHSCHGPAIFVGVLDENGTSIIKDKVITGFTTQGEIDMGIMEPVRSWGEPLIDEWAEKLGAKCKGFEHTPSKYASDADYNRRTGCRCVGRLSYLRRTRGHRHEPSECAINSQSERRRFRQALRMREVYRGSRKILLLCACMKSAEISTCVSCPYQAPRIAQVT